MIEGPAGRTPTGFSITANVSTRPSLLAASLPAHSRRAPMKLANFRNIAYLAVMFVTPIILTLGFVTDR